MNYYRRYVGDFTADTMQLSMMEQGAYDRLLDHYYATEKPIPPNSDRAAIICRAITLEERAAVTLVLETYFERRGDGWHHKRVEKELEAARERTDSAKCAANARWHAPDHAEGNAESMRKSCPPIPTTNHQPPASKTNHQPPETPLAPRKRVASPRAEAQSAETRKAYSEAYRLRYGVEPTWNRTTMAQLARFVEAVPLEDAPGIAQWFLASNRAWYVTKKHPVGALLQDAPALRTEWLTRRQGTETEARLADRTQAVGNAFAGLIAEAKAQA